MNKNFTIKIFAFLYVFLFLTFGFSENGKGNANNVTSTDDNKLDIKSEYEEKKNTILYGLGDDILHLIDTLQTDEDDNFDSDLQKIFSETKIPKIHQRLFQYFAQKKDDCLKQDALIILENRYDYPKDTVSASILYARDLEINDATKFLREILKDEDSDYMTMAILAIGKIGNTEDAVFLTEMFDSEASDDEKKSLIIKQNIATALEELHDIETWDFLVENTNDIDQNSIVRASFASALGKIGDEKAVAILCNLFEDKDPILRSAAIKGLTKFKTKDARDVLLQGFKDSYYKVRLQAIKSAQDEKRHEAIPYILYRAKKDPENSIKYAAIEALSQFNNSDANEWIVNSFKNEKTPMLLRLKIAYYMLKNNFDVIYSAIEESAIKSISDDRRKKFGIELGKIISKIENNSTAPIAESFMTHKDAIIKSIGLDMFKRNKYSILRVKVSEIAENKKNGSLSRRAKKLLDQAGASVESDVDQVENKLTDAEKKEKSKKSKNLDKSE